GLLPHLLPFDIGVSSNQAGSTCRPLHCIPGVLMSATKFLAIAAVGLSLTACAGNPDGSGPGPRENTGTLLGAGTGALLGAAVAGGGTGDRLAGAAIGGLLG